MRASRHSASKAAQHQSFRPGFTVKKRERRASTSTVSAAPCVWPCSSSSAPPRAKEAATGQGPGSAPAVRLHATKPPSRALNIFPPPAGLFEKACSPGAPAQSGGRKSLIPRTVRNIFYARQNSRSRRPARPRPRPSGCKTAGSRSLRAARRRAVFPKPA